MRAVCYFNGVRWIHDYQDACVDKLVRFMVAESSMNAGGRVGGSGLVPVRDGNITPGTPSTAGSMSSLVPAGLPGAGHGTRSLPFPVYNRTQSNESGKGSSCSDDIVGSSGPSSKVNGVAGGGKSD